jgi:hypothetical protein
MLKEEEVLFEFSLVTSQKWLRSIITITRICLGKNANAAERV